MVADNDVLEMVERVRGTMLVHQKHPEDAVHEYLANNTDDAQRKRLYGCTDALQAARRATHGDAFRF